MIYIYIYIIYPTGYIHIVKINYLAIHRNWNRILIK